MRTRIGGAVWRRSALLMGAVLAGSVLAAPGVSAQDPIELEMWSWNNEGSYPSVHEDAIARFEAANPGVTVKRGNSNCGEACGAQYFGYADYLTKFQSSVAAGAPPCIAQIPWAGEFPQYVNSGALIPLTEAFKTGFPAFFEPIVSAVSIGGDVWAVPLDVNTLQIAYNRSKFDELGIGIPQTYSELKDAVAKLSEAGLFGISVGTKDKWAGGDLWFAQVAYTDGTNTKLAQADAGEVGRDDPAFAQAADNVAQMVADGIFAPGANANDAFVGGLDLFVSQAAGMMYPVGNFVTGGIAKAVGDTFEWSLFPFPKPDGSTLDNRATGGIAEMFTVTKDCKNPEQAIEFLRYLVNDEGGAALVANDFIPSWGYAAPTDKGDLYANMLTAQATANSRVIYDSKVYAELLNAMQGVLDGAPGSTLIDAMVAAAAQ